AILDGREEFLRQFESLRVIDSAIRFRFIAIHLFIRPDAHRRRGQLPRRSGAAREEFGRFMGGGQGIAAERVYAIDAWRNTLKAGTCLSGDAGLPREIPVVSDFVARIRMRPDAMMVPGRVLADVPVPAFHVPGKSSREVSRHWCARMGVQKRAPT